MLGGYDLKTRKLKVEMAPRLGRNMWHICTPLRAAFTTGVDTKIVVWVFELK